MVDLLEIAKAVSRPRSAPTKPARALPPLATQKDYAPADLEEMDRLIRELAQMEGWPAEELTDKLDQRRRMAPVNVLPVLREIREAHRAALAVWPHKPAKRSDIRLCKLDHVELAVIDGDKP